MIFSSLAGRGNREGMVRPIGTGGKAEELSRDQIRRLDRCLTGSRTALRDRALIYLGLGSGMRIGELARLRWEDVAPAGKVLSRIVLEKHSTARASVVATSDRSA